MIQHAKEALQQMATLNSRQYMYALTNRQQKECNMDTSF